MWAYISLLSGEAGLSIAVCNLTSAAVMAGSYLMILLASIKLLGEKQKENNSNK